MSEWRKRFKVHPAADLFPMMSDEELRELGEDIKAHGLRKRIVFLQGSELELLDGRNRLEAMERAGVELEAKHWTPTNPSDPVAYVLSANVHRRHLTKEQRATLIVAEALRHDGEGSSWQGKTADPIKAAAVATASKDGISKRTVERAMAKAREQMIDANPSPYEQRQRQRKQAASVKRAEKHKAELARRAPSEGAFELWRRGYLNAVRLRCPDLTAESDLVFNAFEEMLLERDRREAAE